MTPTTRNRLTLLGAVVVAAGALSFVAFGSMGENLVYYWSPKEMLEKGSSAYGKTVRLGGVVQKGSIVWDEAHTRLQFLVADGMEPTAQTVKVSATETPPQMFREGIGVVVEGTYSDSGVFTSKRLMVNHSNEYRAPQEGDTSHDWKSSAPGSEEQARAE